MFANPADPNNCFVEIQAGAGGTEAQDWAQMLLRQYLRYCERKDFKTEVLEESAGEVAGTEGRDDPAWTATMPTVTCAPRPACTASCASRRSTRAAGGTPRSRRSTSTPRSTIRSKSTINPADLRIDVYRASGAGGQHVNKTESAVRITHLPTDTVVQCQNDRSQHRNRDEAMKMLRARLYELELRKRRAEQDKVEASKTDIGWGHQIRSYVLDQSRIKDLRTNVETSNTRAVLDGDLDDFISASLKHGV